MNNKAIRPSVWKRTEEYLSEIRELNTERNATLVENKQLLTEIKAVLIEIKDALAGV